MERFVLGMEHTAFAHGAFFRPSWSRCRFDRLVLRIDRLVSLPARLGLGIDRPFCPFYPFRPTKSVLGSLGSLDFYEHPS